MEPTRQDAAQTSSHTDRRAMQASRPANKQTVDRRTAISAQMQADRPIDRHADRRAGKTDDHTSVLLPGLTPVSISAAGGLLADKQS